MRHEQEFEYYRPSAQRRDYLKPAHPGQVTRDLNKAHDNLKNLVKEKDLLRHKVGMQRIWIRVLTAAVLAQWGILLAIFRYCLPPR